MFSLPFLLKGVAAPAMLAGVVALALRRVCGGGRAVGAVAFAAGQALGTAWLLSDDGAIWPARNLQWPPWVTIGAATLGPMVVAFGLTTLERWWLTLCAALAAAFVLVPTWPDLWPPRLASLMLFALATTVLARALDLLTRQTSPRVVVWSLAGSATAAALLIAAVLSLSLGESALTTAAALTGTAIAMSVRSEAAAVRGLCLPYVLGVGGWCYVSAMEPAPPAPPLFALLCFPAAPLVLSLTAVGPVSRWTPRRKFLVDVALWFSCVAGLAAWLWFGGD